MKLETKARPMPKRKDDDKANTCTRIEHKKLTAWFIRKNEAEVLINVQKYCKWDKTKTSKRNKNFGKNLKFTYYPWHAYIK